MRRASLALSGFIALLVISALATQAAAGGPGITTAIATQLLNSVFSGGQSTSTIKISPGTLANGQSFMWNGSLWVNGTPTPAPGPTTSPWSVVLANGRTSGGSSPTVSTGDQLLLPNGSLATPGLAFTNFTNTGTVAGSNALTFSVAGTDALDLAKSQINGGSNVSNEPFHIQPPGTWTNGSIFFEVSGANYNLSGTTQNCLVNTNFGDSGAASSTTVRAFEIAPQLFYTGASTGHYEALKISANESGGAPSGTNYLIRASAGNSGSVDEFLVRSDGATVLGAATGGFQGPGKLNTQGLYVNGTASFTVDGSGNTSIYGTTTTGAAGPLAQNFTTQGLVLPICLTGAPSGAAANGNVVVGGDNHLWCRINGAWVQVDGGGGTTVTFTVHASVTGATQTIDATATVWPCDTTSNNTTITLPTAVGISGRVYVIKKTVAANTLTIATTSSQTIDGSTTQTVTANGQSYNVVSNGSNWLVF